MILADITSLFLIVFVLAAAIIAVACILNGKRRTPKNDDQEYHFKPFKFDEKHLDEQDEADDGILPELIVPDDDLLPEFDEQNDDDDLLPEFDEQDNDPMSEDNDSDDNFWSEVLGLDDDTDDDFWGEVLGLDDDD